MDSFPIFDELKQVAFSRVLDVMGENAVWECSTGTEVIGRVLFKYPTQPMTIGETDVYEYPPNTPTAEWYQDTFVGLKEASDSHSIEYLLIREKRYFVTKIDTKTDGDTFVAALELVE